MTNVQKEEKMGKKLSGIFVIAKIGREYTTPSVSIWAIFTLQIF